MRTRDVAARLGIGRGLIHHYFDSWEALQREAFVAVATTAQRDVEAKLASLPPAQRLDALLDAVVADADDGHWRLFADAWDEAQRDVGLAEIQLAIGTWWRELMGATLSAITPQGFDANDAAWRLMALADGLSGHLLLARPTLNREAATKLLGEAARMEVLAATAANG